MSDALFVLRDAVADVERRARELDPDAQRLEEWSRTVAAHVLELVSLRGGQAAYTAETGSEDTSIGEIGVDVAAALAALGSVEGTGINQTSGRHFAFIPGGGLFPAALGDLLADAANPYADPDSRRLRPPRWNTRCSGGWPISSATRRPPAAI